MIYNGKISATTKGVGKGTSALSKDFCSNFIQPFLENIDGRWKFIPVFHNPHTNGWSSPPALALTLEYLVRVPSNAASSMRLSGQSLLQGMNAQPLQSLFVGEVMNASYQPCSLSLNSLQMVDICHRVWVTGRHTIFKVWTCSCQLCLYARNRALFARRLSIDSRAYVISQHARWPIRTPSPTCANKDAWVAITPKRPNAISIHTSAWHAWTRTPPLNFVLEAVFSLIHFPASFIRLWPFVPFWFGGSRHGWGLFLEQTEFPQTH